MPIDSPRVTLLAPGCFSTIATSDGDEITDDASGTSENAPTPDINDAQAVPTQTKAYEQALAAALHQPIPDMGALPIAQYQYSVDTRKSTPEHCVCAELIHLQADKDNARLVPESALQLTEEEVSELLGAVNKLINPDGLNVHRTPSGRCYLTGMPAADLDTWPAHAVANGKIANFLPRQSNAGDWRRLLTEVQMLFHSHPVNAQRSGQQRLPVNGMWFWGGARTTELSPVNNLVLIADDAYAQGIGDALKLETQLLKLSSCATLSRDYFQNTASNSAAIEDVVIAELNTYKAWLRGDQSALSGAKKALTEQWITPLQKAVADGLVSEFVLDGCEGQAIVERQFSSEKNALAGNGWLARLIPQRMIPDRFSRARNK